MNDAIDVIVGDDAVDVIVGDVFNEKLTTRHSKFKSAGIFFFVVTLAGDIFLKIEFLSMEVTLEILFLLFRG